MSIQGKKGKILLNGKEFDFELKDYIVTKPPLLDSFTTDPFVRDLLHREQPARLMPLPEVTMQVRYDPVNWIPTFVGIAVDESTHEALLGRPLSKEDRRNGINYPIAVFAQ